MDLKTQYHIMCNITIDAIGTQTKIMNQIKKKKGEFVLPLKKNNQGAYKEVEEYFKDCLELDFYEKIKSKKLEDTITYSLKLAYI